MHRPLNQSLGKLNSSAVRRRWPLTLWIGLGIILICESLLFTDVALSHRHAVHSNAQALPILAHPPANPLGKLARFTAMNMTPLVWVGYIFLLDGILTIQQGESSIRRRPHHFAALVLASIVIWCVFDWVNFYYIKAWDYVGMTQGFFNRFWGYALAFGAIVPGMLMSGQVFLNLGWFDWARSPGWCMPRWAKWFALAAGCVMFAWPILYPDPITNLTLWASLVFMLDPINLKLGRPSMFRDWQAGWYGRTLAAFAGGLLCGFLWEFWNYWALAKWVYHLPFLGDAERFRYFEMPIIGLLGFLPFGMEAWVMWQFMRIPLDGMVEPLPDEHSLL